jgi:hypothetical protein
VVALALVDLLVALGWTADSRDPNYGIGPVMRPRSSSTLQADPSGPDA